MNYNVTKLPAMTPENLEELMAERLAAMSTCETVIPMLWQGLLELPVNVDGAERCAYYYVPAGTPQGSTLVILNTPAGQQPLSFLEQSGWQALADAEGFCLFLLAPGAQGWKSVAEEESYLRAAVGEAKRGRYLLAAFAPYVVAYGAVGSVLQRIVMEDPMHAGAAVFIGADSVDAACLPEIEQKEIVFPDRFNPDTLPLRVPNRVIPTPVWIFAQPDENVDAVLAFWRKAARTGAAQDDPALGILWRQAAPTDYTEESNFIQVALQPKPVDPLTPETTKAIYAFLKQYYRYGMGPLSNLISRRQDADAIGVVRRGFTDACGNRREYLVYVPEAYRGTDAKLPTVLAFHGASQSMRNMLANSRWHEIADREGIVIVYPESTLRPMNKDLAGGTAFAYRPLWKLTESEAHEELAYVNELLDRVIAEFPVDEKRIYSNGHSMGCMMSNYLGSDVTGHRLAAIGATSGALVLREHSAKQRIPAFLTIGQFDLWSYRLQDEGWIADELNMWLVQDGLATPENVSEVRQQPTESWQAGCWVNHQWKDKSGTPWLRYTWIQSKHHVHTPEENRVFWEQWFSRWRIGDDGERHFE